MTEAQKDRLALKRKRQARGRKERGLSGAQSAEFDGMIPLGTRIPLAERRYPSAATPERRDQKEPSAKRKEQ